MLLHVYGAKTQDLLTPLCFLASPDQDGFAVCLMLPWRDMMKHTIAIIGFSLLSCFFLIFPCIAETYTFNPVTAGSFNIAAPTGDGETFSWFCNTHSTLYLSTGSYPLISSHRSNTNKYSNMKVSGYTYNTSSIDDYTSIESVKLSIYTGYAPETGFTGTEWIITSFTPSNPLSYVAADFNSIPQLGNSYASIPDHNLVQGSYTDFTLSGYNVNKEGYSHLAITNNWHYENSITWPGLGKQSSARLGDSDSQAKTYCKLIVITGAAPTPTPTPTATVTTTPNWTPNVTTYPTPSYIPTTPGTFSPFPTINITNPDLLNLTNSSFFPTLIISNIISIWDAILNPIIAIFNIIFSIITWPLTVIANVISNLETLATAVFSSLIGYLQFWSLLFNSFFSSIPSAITSIIVLALVLTGVGLLIK